MFATIGVLLVGVLVAGVTLARWLTTVPGVQDFLATYPGEVALPADAPLGFPAWLAWQHFLSAFLMVMIIRTGWQVRTTRRSAGSWTRKNTLLRTLRPPTKISLELWFHLALDIVWLANGIIFVALLFITGQWMRVVPTSWDVFPNAVSAALQYASLNWPTEDGWVNYNSLQVLSYFVVIFLAAPLSVITGIRMSAAWPTQTRRLNRVYPIELGRAIHFPVMIFFVAFIVVHVTLVFATGALRNLNHMYAVQDGDGWTGLVLFAVSVVVTAAGLAAARPLIIRTIASWTGNVGR